MTDLDAMTNMDEYECTHGADCFVHPEINGIHGDMTGEFVARESIRAALALGELAKNLIAERDKLFDSVQRVRDLADSLERDEPYRTDEFRLAARAIRAALDG